MALPNQRTSKSSHKNSREITIFRFTTHAHEAQKDAVEYMARGSQPIGPYFKSKSAALVGTGLTRDEEDFLMPKLIRLTPEDRDFQLKVSEYFNKLVTKVPYTNGVTLEIGMIESNNKGPVWYEETDEKDKEGEPVFKKRTQNPINLPDYIRYRHALEHPEVALSYAEGKGDGSKRYYVHDVAAVQKVKAEEAGVADEAMTVYLKVKSSTNKVRNLLSLFLIDARKLDKGAVEAELRNIVTKQPGKFLEVYNDDNFETKYWIRQMIMAGVLMEIGSRVVDKNSREPIGHTMEEAVLWFKDTRNSNQVAEYKAATQDAFTHLGKTDEKKAKEPAGAEPNAPKA